jgi:hypothetical protein
MRSLPVIISSVISALVSACATFLGFIFLIFLPFYLEKPQYSGFFEKTQLVLGLGSMLVLNLVAMVASLGLTTPTRTNWPTKLMLANALLFFFLTFLTEFNFITVPCALLYLAVGLISFCSFRDRKQLKPKAELELK